MSSIQGLFRAAPYVRLHRGRVVVLKVGGGSIARPARLARLAEQVAVVHSLGARVVVVHGGGPQTDELQRSFGDEPRAVDGRRVTTPEGLRALRMGTAGELFGDVVAALSAAGVPAVGVSGASDGLLVARRRPPVSTSEGVVDFGAVGDMVSVDPIPLGLLLERDRVPVVCPPATDGAGAFLNVNADVVAAHVAVALGAAKLVLVTGAPGILEDPDDPSTLVSAIALGDLERLTRDGTLRAGMHVKGAAIGHALRGGVERVHVVSGSDPEAVVRELYTTHGAGTLVTREPLEAAGPDEAAAVDPEPSTTEVVP